MGCAVLSRAWSTTGDRESSALGITYEACGLRGFHYNGLDLREPMAAGSFSH